MRNVLFSCGGYGYILERGEISTSKMRREYGVWTLGQAQECRPSIVCGCHHRKLRKKVVPHVFFSCPHCLAVNSEFAGSRSDAKGDRPFSLHCKKCERHLWVAFKGYDVAEYVKMAEGKT